jgi:hypothetical protein
MHSQQKAAWFVLIVIAGTLVLYGLTVPVFSWWFGHSMAEVAVPALGLFGLTGLTGFAGLFYHRLRGQKEPAMDERDWMLSRRAWIAGMAAFWLLFCIGGMGIWAYLYCLRGLQRVTVPVGVFPGMIFAGFIIFMLARSVATLHYYGWRGTDAGR